MKLTSLWRGAATSMGEAKSWCLREILSCFAGSKSRYALLPREERIIHDDRDLGSGPKRLFPGVPFWQMKSRMISQPITGISISNSHHRRTIRIV